MGWTTSSWAFEDFVEMGIKVVDTLQPEATNMSLEYLKKTFEIMKPGGGYFMAPTHMIQDNGPTENVVAAHRAALDFGRH